MNRSQFIAALLVIGIVGALVATQLGGDDPVTEAAEPSAGAAAPTGSTAQDPPDAPAEPEGDTAPAPTLEVADPPPVLDPKPALTDLDGWLQTEATSLDDFDGQVRIVEFWTFGCFNCKNRLPYTQAIYERYQPDGLEIIGVHAPEFEYERDPARIAEAAVDLGVTWPIALDTRKTNFRAWQENRRFWPRVYVLDQNGQVRYDHIGEGDYDGLEETVAYLIENGP
ncbi:MAG: redoxin domain-containing protein [Actinomycetota bacterium]